jgi:hypothetical protein
MPYRTDQHSSRLGSIARVRTIERKYNYHNNTEIKHPECLNLYLPLNLAMRFCTRQAAGKVADAAEPPLYEGKRVRLGSICQTSIEGTQYVTPFPYPVTHESSVQIP